MNRHRRSRTADIMAVSRAIDSMQPASERVCFDPLASKLLPVTYRLLLTRPIVRNAILSRLERGFPGHHGYVIARTAYMDEQVELALAEGIEQIVILGAGWDSRPYRLPGIGNVSVFEVDHPASQAAKRKAIVRLFGGVPRHVRFVPVDFDRDFVPSALMNCGHLADRSTFFLWEGTTPYLGAAAVDETLAFVSANGGSRSRIAFDYIAASLVTGGHSSPDARREAAKMALTDEPFTFGIDPDGVEEFLSARGFESVQSTTSAMLAKRAFPPQRASQPVKDWWHLVRADVRYRS